jgi:hypothetical protein
MVALNDEEGKLFRFNPGDKDIPESFKFLSKGDFEDLCFDGTYWYALKSKGMVIRISHAFTDSFSLREFPFPEKGNEFETIFFDPSTKKPIVICKLCINNREGKIPAFSLDTSTAVFSYEPNFSPDTVSIMNILQKKKIECRPSGAAINPLTGELYIISSSDRLLLIMKDGMMKQAFKLPKEFFRQPEGICFAPNGDLYISNEAKGEIANILLFRYDPAKLTQ